MGSHRPFVLAVLLLAVACGDAANPAPGADSEHAGTSDLAGVEVVLPDAPDADPPADSGPGADVAGGSDAAGADAGTGGDVPADAPAGESGSPDVACGECLDGICQPECGETSATCPGDCVKCRNGKCEPGEGPTTCPEDCCGGCGDGICQGYSCGEDPAICPLDCGTACGNKLCDKGESPKSCPMDCAWQVCGNGICEPADGGPAKCPSDCSDTCGNCECEGTEDWLSCPVDCGYCGDGVCSPCAALQDEKKNCVPDCGPNQEVCNGFDDDDDGATDEPDAVGCVKFYRDMDGDGFGSWTDWLCLCAPTSSWSAYTGADCDDGNALSHPGAVERCDGFDNDCNGITDDPGADGCQTFYRDMDLDGYGTDLVAPRCLCGPEGASAFTAHEAGDCLDMVPEVFPGAPETCDGYDNDCDGTTDPEDAVGCLAYYLDGDGDGFGQAGASRCLCGPEGSWTTRKPTDCDDSKPSVHPDATENCGTTWDDNCNGQMDEQDATGCTPFHLDQDGDGWGLVDAECRCSPKGLFKATKVGDCDDLLYAVHPGAKEDCLTPEDDDCDGLTDVAGAAHCKLFYRDDDGDGYGVDESVCRCGGDGKFTALLAGDCAPSDPAVSPGAAEACATPADDNCDGSTDSAGAVGCTTWYRDADGDGYGADGQCRCKAPAGYGTTIGGDCDDTKPSVFPSPHAVCGDDGDCDGDRVEPGEDCDPLDQIPWNGCFECAASEFRLDAGSAPIQKDASISVGADGRTTIAWGDVSSYGTDILVRRWSPDFEALGAPIKVNSLTQTGNMMPRVASLTDGRFAVTWFLLATDGSASHVRVFSADGKPMADSFLVDPDPGYTAVVNSITALSEGRYAVAWTRGASPVVAMVRLFKAGGQGPDSAPIALPSTTAVASTLPAIAGQPGGGLVAVWAAPASAYDTMTSVIRGQRFLSDGTKTGSEFTVATQKTSTAFDTASTPDVMALSDGRFAVSWVGINDGITTIRARWYLAAGTPVGSPVDLSTSDLVRRETSPSIAVTPSGRTTVSWIRRDDTTTPSTYLGIHLRQADWGGTGVGPVMQANTMLLPKGVSVSSNEIAGYPDGRMMPIWVVSTTGTYTTGVYGVRFDASSHKLYR